MKQIDCVNGLKQIADASGVSVMTVSRALRLDSRVAPATRTRILAIAEQLNYQAKLKPGRPRKSSKSTHSLSTVAVIAGATSKPNALYYVNLLFALEQELALHNLQCAVFSFNGSYESLQHLRERLRFLDPLGILFVGYLAPLSLRSLLELGGRLILVDHPGEPELGENYDSIAFDNVTAARLAVTHLLEQGRRSIALLRGLPQHYFSREIEQGYREAHKLLGIKVQPDLFWECDATIDGASRCVTQALNAGKLFDAVFTNDEMACGALQSLHAAGKQVPCDVAVAGCDGLTIGRYVYPSLTTVRLDCAELSRAALECLLSSMQISNRAPRRIRLIPKLEINESTSNNIKQEKKWDT